MDDTTLKILILVLMFIVGACFGSFLCCQARRLHLMETDKKKLGKRSVCLHCGYKLKWYDNIPIISWLLLRGKCRKCHEKIGKMEITAEVLSGLALLMIGTTADPRWFEEINWILLAVISIFTLSIIFLAIYDGAYGKLPVTGLVVSIALGFIYCVLNRIFMAPYYGVDVWTFLNPVISVAILGGVYLVLYLVSKGRWVGDGDWLLGTAIGLALIEPWLALVTLFVANVLACAVMAPAVKKSKNKKIYFGPFMVIAFVITYTFADFFMYALGGLVV